jgi:hypothetical protein
MGFKSGAEWNGNRNGRGEGKFQKEFRAALAQVEKKKEKTLLVHLIERAYADDSVLVAVSKKMLPDKLEVEDQLKDRIILIRPAVGEIEAKKRGNQTKQVPR